MSSAGFQSQKNARREKIEVNGLTGADKLRISQLPWQQGQKTLKSFYKISKKN